MTVVKNWLARQVSPLSPVSPALEGQSAGASEREEGGSSIVRARAGDSDTSDTGDSCASKVAWTERPDVILAVEDLFRERWHPHRIARELGLTREDVRMILHLTGGCPVVDLTGG
jgi:hypothetical protein